jgi:hypothetical protein
MRTVNGVFRNGKIESLEDLDLENNTKVLIIVTDEKVPEQVVTNEPGVSAMEKIRRRTSSEISTEQQISSREKLKQVVSHIEGKIPYDNLEEATARLRRYSNDTD